MVSKQNLRKLALFENHMAMTVDFDELWTHVKKLEAISKEKNDPSILEYTEEQTRKTKPLTEQSCAYLIKSIIKADLENKDKHMDALLNPEVSEQRTYIKENWELVPDSIERYKAFSNSIALPNLDLESGLTIVKVSSTKFKNIVFKLAGLID